MLERSVVSLAEPGSASVLELHEMNKDSCFIKARDMTSSFTSLLIEVNFG